MKISQTVSLSLLLLLLSNHLFAQQSWSLKQCIAYGLQHSPTMQVAKNNEYIAHQQKRQVLSGYLPQVNGSASFDDNLKRQVSVLPAGIFGPEPTTIQFGTKYTSLLNATLNQTVLDYAIIIGIKANKYNVAVAELTAQQTKEQLIYDIAQAYYQVLLSEEQIIILQSNQQLYSKLLPIMQIQAEKGVLAKIEVDKVQVTLNNTEARLANVRNIKDQAFNVLKFQMGMYDENATMTLSDTIPANASLPELDTRNAFDFKQHTAFKIQENLIRLNEYDAQRIRSGGIPRLSITGNYGAQAYSDAFGDLYKRLYDFSAVGLRLTIPLFDGFGRNAQWKQKNFEIDNMKAQLDIAHAQMKLQHDNARMQLRQNYINLQTNQRNIDLAKKVFNTTNLQYEKGVAPLSEVLQAEQSLQEAQNNFMSTMVNYYQAKLEFENANSSLLNYYTNLPE